MKKTLILVVTIVMLGIVLSSCKTREKCPAYGESHKFQVEQRY